MPARVPEDPLHGMEELLTRTDKAGRAMHDLGRIAHNPLKGETANRYLVYPAGDTELQLTAHLYRTNLVEGESRGEIEREPVTLERPFEAVTYEVVIPYPELRFISRAVALEPETPAPKWWSAETGEIKEVVNDDYSVSSSNWTLEVNAQNAEGLRRLLRVIGLNDSGKELWQWPSLSDVPKAGTEVH